MSNPPSSPLAATHGHIPIFAVSSSLVEGKRQEYINCGFDAWALKPVNFSRLSELIEGVHNSSKREGCFYAPGRWEHGGWL